MQWGSPHRRCSEEVGCRGKALRKTICRGGDASGMVQHPAANPLTYPAGPCPPPPPAPECRSHLPAPPADRAAIDARSRLTCSRRAEGAPTMGCLCALAGAEPAAPRLKYKQPGRHSPPRPRSPGGKAPAFPTAAAGTPQPRRTRERDAAPRRSGRFLPSPPVHPRGAAGCRLHGWGMLQCVSPLSAQVSFHWGHQTGDAPMTFGSDICSGSLHHTGANLSPCHHRVLAATTLCPLPEGLGYSSSLPSCVEVQRDCTGEGDAAVGTGMLSGIPQGRWSCSAPQ